MRLVAGVIAAAMILGSPSASAASPRAPAESALAIDTQRWPGLGSVRATRHGELIVLEGQVSSPEDRDLAERLARANGGGREVLNRIDIGMANFDGVMPALRQSLLKLQQLLGRLPLLLLAAFVAWLVWRAGHWVSRRAWIARLTRNPLAGEIVRQALRILAAVLGVLVALEILGATALAAAVLGSAGIAGIALGFAFRDLLENYIAGVLLSVRQPFAPDDVIQLEGREGVVVGMNSRATILMTHDGNHLTFPNAIVFKSVILNLTRNGNRRFEFLVDLHPQVDVCEALRVGLEALRGAEGVLRDPAPFVQVNEVGRDLVQLQFFAWVDQRVANFGQARSEAMRTVRSRLEEVGAYFGPPLLRLVSEAEAIGNEARERARPGSASVPSPADAPDERSAVDAAIAKTRVEMQGRDLLRGESRE